MSPLLATATPVGVNSPPTRVLTLPVAGLTLSSRPLKPSEPSSGPPERLVT